MYPTTDGGRIVGTLTMITGMIVLAMPITVIGSAFSAEYKIMKAETAADDASAKAEQEMFERLVVVEEALLAGLDEQEAEAAGDEAAAALSAKKMGGVKVAPEPPKSPSLRSLGSFAAGAAEASPASKAAEAFATAASDEASDAARSSAAGAGADAGAGSGTGAGGTLSSRGLGPSIEDADVAGAARGDATGAAVLALLRDLRGQIEAQAAELRQLRKESHALRSEVRKGFAAL